jgi:hypothetical protein
MNSDLMIQATAMISAQIYGPVVIQTSVQGSYEDYYQ